MFSSNKKEPYYLSRSDVNHPLASWSKYHFELDGENWPSVEHYYQGMKFEPGELREAIRNANHPKKAQELASTNKKQIRGDWKDVREVMMTRAIYIKCRTHESVTDLLLATDDQIIIENSQYDYFWGCGRDGRGRNAFGKALMAVREKLRAEQSI